jgi:hypothetical protein
MEFEPDENGYLEWESNYGLTVDQLAEEGEEPRTEDEMVKLFQNELWEYILENVKYSDIQVNAVQVEQL